MSEFVDVAPTKYETFGTNQGGVRSGIKEK
jgi:hypothetical protein